MMMKKNAYYNPSAKELPVRWYLLDAQGQRLGKVAARAAQLLMGKHEPTFVPHLDNGVRVVVINAAGLDVHPRKVEGKLYWRHSGYPGGIRSRSLGEMMESRPEDVVRQAVKGMLPKNRIGSAYLRKLYVYAGPEHEQQAQKPEQMGIV